MENRNFKLDTEWNMIHYPERPNGFGIFIIGDERHFVDEKTSFWMQNEGKLALIKDLKHAGYTVFYSNLYRKNWGSGKAVHLARRLYEFVIRTEIINEKIHLLAEGMGALVALKLIEEMGEQIRSVILINPVLSLKEHVEQEKNHKLFYKKLMRELSQSYEIELGKVNEIIQKESSPIPRVPTKIIYVLTGNGVYKQSKRLKELSEKWEETPVPLSISYVVPEKRIQLNDDILHFYQTFERLL